MSIITQVNPPSYLIWCSWSFNLSFPSILSTSHVFFHRATKVAFLKHVSDWIMPLLQILQWLLLHLDQTCVSLAELIVFHSLTPSWFNFHHFPFTLCFPINLNDVYFPELAALFHVSRPWRMVPLLSPLCGMLLNSFFFNHTSFYFRESNGTPLRYSCLETPTDGGAW